jgi:hypothetical protein
MRFIIGMLLAVLPTLAAAAEPELWIAGLSLPPDASNVTREAVQLDGLPADAAEQYDLLEEGTEQALLAVTFDSALSWADVQAHVAAALAPTGYASFREERKVRRFMARGNDRAQAEAKTARLFTLADGMTGINSDEFAAAGSNYYVMLSEVERSGFSAKLADATVEGYNRANPDDPPVELPMPHYTLIVLQLAAPYPADLTPQRDAAAAPEQCGPETACVSES